MITRDAHGPFTFVADVVDDASSQPDVYNVPLGKRFLAIDTASPIEALNAAHLSFKMGGFELGGIYVSTVASGMMGPTLFTRQGLNPAEVRLAVGVDEDQHIHGSAIGVRMDDIHFAVGTGGVNGTCVNTIDHGRTYFRPRGTAPSSSTISIGEPAHRFNSVNAVSITLGEEVAFRPLCDDAHRGTFFPVKSPPGTADRVEVCLRAANGALTWSTLFTP